MGVTPLPDYAQLAAMGRDSQELLARFIVGLVENPPRRAPRWFERLYLWRHGRPA